LISSVNKPRVRMINGHVNNFNKGLRKAFTNPKIKASQITLTHPLWSEMPGTKRTARKIATALIAQRRINLVIVFSPLRVNTKK
jgi:hypothetical protein